MLTRRPYNGSVIRRFGVVIGIAASLLVSSAGATTSARAPACTSAQLKATVGPGVSEKTGQHTLTVVLRNGGPNACLLSGYPRVAFVDSRGRVPFVIRDGGDQMVTSKPPRPVLVRPNHAAFVVVNKYRCDGRDLRFPRRLRLGLGRLSLAVPAHVHFAYCGIGDPGSVVSVSPFERTQRAALAGTTAGASGCTAASVQAWLSTQGTAAQSVTFLMLRNRRTTACLFSAVVRFEVMRNGRRAGINGNPLRARLHAFLEPSRTAYAVPDVWWANWCGPRQGLEMTAHFWMQEIRSRFSSWPVCLSRTQPSTLSVPKP